MIKVGDRVRLVAGLGHTDMMDKFVGKEATVTRVGETFITTDVDPYYNWSWDPATCIKVHAPTTDSVCAEADKTAGQDRQRDYGHPLDNHERIAGMWSVVLGDKLKKPITAEEAALCMCALKIAREINTPKRDNLVDLCGYAKCLEMIYSEREKRKGEKK